MCPKKREKKVACQQSLVKAPAVGRTGGPHGVLYPIFLQRQTLQLPALRAWNSDTLSHGSADTVQPLWVLGCHGRPRECTARITVL